MSELAANVDVVQSLLEAGPDGKFATVLLIKYPDDDSAYTDWIDAILPRLHAVGARIVWAANGGEPIVGDPDRRWDVIVVVEYPDRQAFVDLIQGGGWTDVDELRMTGMERNEVYGCSPVIDAVDHGPS